MNFQWLIGLDLGMNIGWASGIPGALPDSGVFKLTPCKGDYGALMEEYGNWLRPQLRPGCWVAYEAPIVHRNNTMHGIMITAGLAVETERLCREVSKDINYTSYSVATIKKTFAGHGFAPKSSMMEIARRLGADVSANHEADALGVWYCLLGLYDRMRKTSHLTEQLSPLFMNRTTP